MRSAKTLCSVSCFGFLIRVRRRYGRLPQTATNAQAEAPTPGEKAWGILGEGWKDENADKRAKAVRALSLLTGNAEAEKTAASALQDKKRTCGWRR